MRLTTALACLVLLAGCDSADDLSPVDTSAGVAVTTEADLLAARDAWRAAQPALYRFAYTLSCEECPGGDRVTVRNGQVVETRFRETESAQTLDDLFETAREAFRPGFGGEIRLSQTAPRFPVLIRIGRTEPETFPTSYSGLVVTVTGVEVQRR